MRLALSGLFLASTCLVPAFAADFNTTSKIDHVTVYPQGADVTRIAEVNVPAGEHRIILSDLPASVDPRSIRVEGEGSSPLEIASVDTKSLYINQAERDAQRKVIEKEIASLYDERTALDQTIADANQQRTFLSGLADKQFVPQSSTEPVKGIDVVQLTNLLDLIGTRMAGLAKTIQDSQLRQRGIDEKVQELSAKLNMLAPTDSYHTETTINVAANAEMKGTLRVSYRLMEAGWAPYYDARLTTADTGLAKLQMVRRAEVTQYTSENWDNVSLTLSTTRPTGTTAAPELGEEELMAQARRDELYARKQMNLATEAPASAPVADALQDMENEGAIGAAKVEEKDKKDVPKAIEQRQAIVELAGFQANFVIPGRVVVDNSGQAKKVRISSDDNDAKLTVVSVPRLDPN
ncbi:MAG: mucoidy inhibitor MuiA family protein, partial [Phyllobacteriaceae bacterium]|nr:mucoidy inhibitor MuiA family protein [Phyllobacteriaceae bacterium]